MKRNRLLGGLLALCLCLSLLAPAAFAAPRVTGVWEGYYYANQGQTGLTLTLREDGTGTFEFYNMPGRSNAADGSYTVEYTVDGTELSLVGKDWIEQPSGYHFVGLVGTVSGDEYTGYVSDSNSSSVSHSFPFYLIQDNQAKQELDKSVFGGHRYQCYDQSMTWEQAKACCESLGGYLACINSLEEQDYIQSLIADGQKNAYWLGGYRDGSGFRWLDGSSMSYTCWDSSEPDNHRSAEACMQLYRLPNPAVSGSAAYCWNDAPSDNTIPGEEDFFSLQTVGFICEWDAYSDSSEWATPELSAAAEAGLIPASLVGQDMSAPITRGEFAAVVVKLYEQLHNTRTVMSDQAKFQDIARNVNRNDILKAYNISAVRGISETAYAPDTLLNREQMATMLCRVIKRSTWPEWTVEADGQEIYRLDLTGSTFFTDHSLISDYARESVYYMAKSGIILGRGDGSFGPRNTTSQQEAEGYANATREQALAISLRIYNQMR